MGRHSSSAQRKAAAAEAAGTQQHQAQMRVIEQHVFPNFACGVEAHDDGTAVLHYFLPNGHQYSFPFVSAEAAKEVGGKLIASHVELATLADMPGGGNGHAP